MSTPVAERGRAVTFMTATGLCLGLMVAFGILVLSLQGEGPTLLSLLQNGAHDGYLAMVQLWSGVESFLARAMYR